MKKKFTLLLLYFICFGCSKPSDCIESTGTIITKEVQVSTFDKLKVYQGISVIITEGTIQKVEIETGENLMGDIEVKVENGMLILKDNTSCNWVRDYGQTIVRVTSPNITDFISKTEKNISSNGILHFPIIRLQAIDLTDGAGTGDFHFQVDNNQVVIESNNVSNFYISGQTTDFTANFYEGNGRIEAQNLLANNISIFQRGSNDMILKPLESIKGNIYSTGNVICKNHPPIVEVNVFYQGQLIFN